MTYTEHWSCETRPVPDRYRIVWQLRKSGDFIAGSYHSCLIFSEKDLVDALSDCVKHAARIKNACVKILELPE